MSLVPITSHLHLKTYSQRFCRYKDYLSAFTLFPEVRRKFAVDLVSR